MKFDRQAEIPISHRFADFVCVIGVSDKEGDFGLVSVRRAEHGASVDEKTSRKLYLRILREPALRAQLLEALTPNFKAEISELREKVIAERGANYGFWLGVVALFIVGYVLNAIATYLSRHVGEDWAWMIVYIPMFFAVLVIMPVQHLFGRWYARRYCLQHGHRIQVFHLPKIGEITSCSRCGFRATK